MTRSQARAAPKPEAKYGLPDEVFFCTRCVIPNQRPTTTLEVTHDARQAKPTTAFDDEGVCDACRWAVMKETGIDWAKRHDELVELLDRHRSADGSWDVIVPASGGKDSTYVAHMLKYEYGMHPLTVTWSPALYTDIGRRNLDNFIQSGFDNILITPSGKVHRLLTRLAFVNLGHPMQPFVFGQRNVGPRVALQHGIRLVFYGDNVAEYGNRLEDNFSPDMDERLYTSIDIDNPDALLGGVTVRELRERHGLTRADLQPYGSVGAEAVRSAGIEFKYFSYYRKWVPQDNYYYAMEHSKFNPNVERTQGSYSKYSSIDDKIDPFHYYMCLIKFGMGRATCDAAQEIRTGKITREEGIALVRRYDMEFPDRYFGDFLEYTGLTEEEFRQVVDKFRSPHLWTNEEGAWKLRHPVE